MGFGQESTVSCNTNGVGPEIYRTCVDKTIYAYPGKLDSSFLDICISPSIETKFRRKTTDAHIVKNVYNQTKSGHGSRRTMLLFSPPDVH